VLIAVYALLNFDLSKRINILELEHHNTTSQAISLHEELGYGGLIHNFKNYLLRGEERYYNAAKKNADQALTKLQSLEAEAKIHNLDIRLPQTRLMIESYGSSLEIVKSLNSHSVPVKHIDNKIRYDDTGALIEIYDFVETINTDIEEELADLQRLSLIQTIATITASMFIIFFALLLSRISNHRAELQTLNNDLSVTLDKTEKANIALNQFAGAASHDLRSPIRHVKLFADLIKEDAENPDEVKSHAENIQNSANRMNALVTSLLALAKTSNVELHRSMTDLGELAESVIKEMQPQIREAGANVKLGDLPSLNVDRTLMHHVFENLLDNAIKYSEKEPSPEIEINAERVNGAWEFSFTDNGIGIDSQYVDKIFLPLQRLHSHSSDYQGVGIGLALVKNVIEAHQGQLWLDPDYVSGARFKFTL
jgi:signal transduction histidine kinase